MIIPKDLDKKAYANMQIKQAKYKKIISILRKDGRATLSNISKELSIPITTVFEYMKQIKEHYRFTIVRRKKDGNNKENKDKNR